MDFKSMEFKREKSSEYVKALEGAFRRRFDSLGYGEHDPVSLCSGIDPTVRFIGSTVSIFKPYIIDRTVPEKGFFLIQDCLRTQNIQHIFNDESLGSWASFFTGFGIIVPSNKLNKIIQDVFNFFIDDLHVLSEDINLRISSTDEDLLHAAYAYDRLSKSNFEVDSNQINYYRHHIGIDGISGRNFNIALRHHKTGEFADVGNIILLEGDAIDSCVEVALGLTTIIKQLVGLDHPLDCFPVILDVQSSSNVLKRKLEDAIVVSTKLLHENQKPDASTSRGRVLRTYLRSINYLYKKLDISLLDLKAVISRYESLSINTNKSSTTIKIIEYIIKYESELAVKQALSSEDEKVRSAYESDKYL